VFLIAIAAGIISNVPGGVGVFESVFLLLFQAVPADHLLGSLLAYRHHLLPGSLCRGADAARRARDLGAPGTHRADCTAGAHLAQCRYAAGERPRGVRRRSGAALLGRNAGASATASMLRHVVPLPVLELSHLLGSAVGVGLMVLANGLYRRLDAAWYLTMWLLCAGVLLSLLKGFDYEAATILGAVAVILVSARSRFRRRASLIEQRFSISWVVAVLLVLGAATWLVLFAYRHVPYSNQLWWQFAFEAPAPRSLRGLVLAIMIAAVYALWRLLRPSKPAISPPSEADLERAAAIIHNAHVMRSANLALLGDKNLLFNEDRTAFIMYQASGSSWVSMGDPVGPPAAYEPLVWTFIENCDGMAVDRRCSTRSRPTTCRCTSTWT
jgi:phosphatidylglycerol lysyltransferase